MCLYHGDRFYNDVFPEPVAGARPMYMENAVMHTVNLYIHEKIDREHSIDKD